MAAIKDIEMIGFDLETTGADKETAHIVTLSLTNPEKDILINPAIPIEEGAAQVHGITNERAKAEGVPITDILDDFLIDLTNIINSDDKVLVGFNLIFDLTILEYEAKRNNITPLSQRVEYPFPILDGFVLDKAINPFRKGKRTLETLAGIYDVEGLVAHNGLSDARASIGVIKGILSNNHTNTDPRIAQMDFMSLDHKVLANWHIPWREKQNRSTWDYFVNTMGRQDFVLESGFPIEDRAIGRTPVDYNAETGYQN